jgi:dTDP-4-dehydrorhamnose 3,5-epimerase
MIDGVIIKELQSHCDDRGFFREIIRSTDDFFAHGFGQLSHSLVNKGVVKAWHAHVEQSQWNYVVNGLIKVALYDNRKNSESYGELMEFDCGNGQEAKVYCFPPGVLHGYKCIEGPMNIIYVCSGTYDLNDEIRIGHSEVDYDWSK